MLISNWVIALRGLRMLLSLQLLMSMHFQSWVNYILRCEILTLQGYLVLSKGMFGRLYFEFVSTHLQLVWIVRSNWRSSQGMVPYLLILNLWCISLSSLNIMGGWFIVLILCRKRRSIYVLDIHLILGTTFFPHLDSTTILALFWLSPNTYMLLKSWSITLIMLLVS